MSGTADVEVFALMQAHGLDPAKMETIKTLMEYAKTASTGGGSMISGDLYKPQVFAMLSQVLLDPTIPGEIRQTVGQMFPQQSSKLTALRSSNHPHVQPSLPVGDPPSQVTVSPVPLTDVQLTIEKVSAMLDGLDLQLAEGKISEGTYQSLKAKWERKLSDLKAAEEGTHSST